mgnify:CR=1 FL=1
MMLQLGIPAHYCRPNMTPPKELNVLVVVPSGAYWLAEFSMSLLGMLGYFNSHKVPGFSGQSIRVANVKGSILSTSRLNGLKGAKEIDASHLLYLDTDHTFPADMLHQLLNRNKDVVAANCTIKKIPALPTARAKSEHPQGEVVFTDEANKGLERVWRVGTGVMLLSKRAYMQIPHGAFAMVYKEDEDTYQGEDWTMCEALEKAGVPIYIDHRVSWAVGHVGNFEFTHEYVGYVPEKQELEVHDS